MGVLAQVISVFNEIAQWIGTGMNALIPIFWNAEAGTGGELTFFGVLACAGLAFSVIFLILSIVAGFLHFRA